MEKLAQLRNKLLKFLPREPVVASMAFQVQNPTLSPSRSLAGGGGGGGGGGSRTPSHHIVSIVPKEARRKLVSSSFSAREPTSPKVSCMGEVKGKNKKKKKKRKTSQRHKKNPSDEKKPSDEKGLKKEKMLLWIFKGSGEGESPKQRKALVLELEEKKAPPDAETVVPSLGSMKKFAGGRETLCDFDVKLAQL